MVFQHFFNLIDESIKFVARIDNFTFFLIRFFVCFGVFYHAVDFVFSQFLFRILRWHPLIFVIGDHPLEQQTLIRLPGRNDKLVAPHTRYQCVIGKFHAQLLSHMRERVVS